MDAGKFAQEMLDADSTIRYVAVVSNDYRILASKQREGVPPLTSEEMQRNFVSIVPQIIIESVNKLSPFLGEVEGVTAHYAEVLLVFYQFEDMIVVISFQPEVATPFYNRITEVFKKNSTKFLT